MKSEFNQCLGFQGKPDSKRKEEEYDIGNDNNDEAGGGGEGGLEGMRDITGKGTNGLWV